MPSCDPIRSSRKFFTPIRASSSAFLLFALALSGCLKKPDAPKRLAILRFEDLAPAPDTSWIGRALSEELIGQLQGTRHQAVLSFATLHQVGAALGQRPVAAPGVSTEREAAIASGANRLVTGYYAVRDGQLTIDCIEEDLVTHAQHHLAQQSGALDDILHLAGSIAHELDEEARPPITGVARALRSYSLGLETSSPDLLEEALGLDPDFGPPYVALARLALERKDATAFAAIFDRARTRGSSIDPVDRALLNLEDARLHAAPPAQIDALGALVRLTPADPFALRQLANAELAANRYAEAADHFFKLAALLPQDTSGIKGAAYSLMFAGDDSASAKAFDQYIHARPNDPDTLDSLADAHFFFGRFSEAEKFYLQAEAKSPGAPGSLELLKAAAARLMTGDAAGAISIADRYRTTQSRDPLAAFHFAQFLHRAGRAQQANDLLATYSSTAPPQIAQAAQTQLAWWQLIDTHEPGAVPDSPMRAAVLAFVRKDWPAALPLWKTLTEQSSPDDWWTRAVYARALTQAGQTAEAARFNRFHPIPQPSRALSLDELWAR